MTGSAELPWSGCVNARDIGGLATGSGRVTRRDVLIRAESLHHLDADGVRAVRAHGVDRIIDLRSDWELDDTPHPFAGTDLYLRVPWIDDERDAERDADAERTLADMYRGSLDRNTRRIAAVVSAVDEAPGGPVVVHCMSGKDRTGMLVALLLDLVGVPRERIAADYALSEKRLALRDPAGRPSPTQPEVRVAPDLMSRTLPQTILDALAHLDRRHGGVRAYLIDCGVASSALDRLTARLVVAATRKQRAH
ncbi:MAG: protein-tyrosine-phosphatase [Micromonosporaceae bacterium]|nr:protein-tyrosine-phosphatase [Micromonosporaceae bacterium]